MSLALSIVLAVWTAPPARAQDDPFRQVVIDRGLAEAYGVWISGSGDAVLSNLYHPNYSCPGYACDGILNVPTSSWVDAPWILDQNGDPLVMAWVGNPYCLGCNDRMVSNQGVVNDQFQYSLSAGHGIGAHCWHHCNWPVDPWAVGIDCSELAGQIIFGQPDHNTLSLWNQSSFKFDLLQASLVLQRSWFCFAEAFESELRARPSPILKSATPSV